MGCFSLQQTGTDPSSQAEPQTPHPTAIAILGAGPAGSAAAIAAAIHGAAVDLYEKSRTPRHKVCGEFLSPEIVPILDRLGVWDTIQAAGAFPVRRALLHFPRTIKTSALPGTAFGFSRFALDAALLQRALELGVHLHRCAGTPGSGPVVVASGRLASTPPGGRGHRLFGFKAHFEGPQDDAVELFFADGLYVGVNSIEGGRTNVCGLAPERLLASHGFDYDAVCDAIPALRARLWPLKRCLEWLSVGPVVYRNNLRTPGREDVYPAGDALSFVDPFTGTGIANAVFSGELAGRCAATGVRKRDYLQECGHAMSRSYKASEILRRIFEAGWAGLLAPVAHPSLLYRATRPAFGTQKKNR